jgi:hypothetical protein
MDPHMARIVATVMVDKEVNVDLRSMNLVGWPTRDWCGPAVPRLDNYRKQRMDAFGWQDD